MAQEAGASSKMGNPTVPASADVPLATRAQWAAGFRPGLYAAEAKSRLVTGPRLVGNVCMMSQHDALPVGAVLSGRPGGEYACAIRLR